MPSAYRVANWPTKYENNRTRELKRLDWVPVPNDMSNLGYLELIDHPEGAAHLGAWVAILEIASKQNPRGEIPQASAGTPQALAMISRLPVNLFAQVIPRLVSLGWLEVVSNQELAKFPQDGAGIPQDGAEKPALKGIEGKGIEGKGIEEKEFLLPGADAPADRLAEMGWVGVSKTPEDVCAAIAALRCDEFPESRALNSPFMIVCRLTWFDDFWAFYWRKDDKRKARIKYFEKVTTAKLQEEVENAVIAQSPEMLAREKQHRKLAATWLHGECWTNEPTLLDGGE